MNTLVFDQRIVKILTIFSISPGSKFNRNELKEKTMLFNVSLDNALNILQNSKVLNKKGKIYELNFENVSVKTIIEIVNQDYKYLRELPLTVYFLLLDFLMINELKDLEVYLFGSYSKLVYSNSSDIDLAVLGKNAQERKINSIANKLEKKYSKKIEVHYFNKDNFYKNKTDPLVKEILRNGIRLV